MRRSPIRDALAALLAGACLCAFASGCTVVKPWERDMLSRKDMGWDPDSLEAARRSHVYFAKEASLPGGGTGRGGCGCN